MAVGVGGAVAVGVGGAVAVGVGGAVAVAAAVLVAAGVCVGVLSPGVPPSVEEDDAKPSGSAVAAVKTAEPVTL